MRECTTLYIITEYCGGMRPYALSILNSVWDDNSHAIIVIREKILREEFKEFDQQRIQFIDYPENKIKRILFRIYPSNLISAIKKTIKEANIDILHTLTGDLILATAFKSIIKQTKVLHTIHDARTHDTKYLSLKHLLNDKLFIEYPNNYLNRLSPNIITNSKDQLEYLKTTFPKKKCFYSQFPTLITPEIIAGDIIVSELKDCNNYILFFGQISLYKGVHHLYNMYCSHPELHKYPLVIAGKGELYFSRNDNNGNIIIVNRFFEDAEISDIFSKAAIVVYPYISATQSGVQSIAAYYGKKMILSDIPFFSEIATDVAGISLTNINDYDEFANKTLQLINSAENTRSFYETTYTSSTQKHVFQKHYSDLIEEQNSI